MTRAHTGLVVVREAVWVTGQGGGDWLAGRGAPSPPHGRASGVGWAELAADLFISVSDFEKFLNRGIMKHMTRPRSQTFQVTELLETCARPESRALARWL